MWMRTLYSKEHKLVEQESTPFVGRERELAEINRLLDDPNCRLLTLLGPGGIGKTRLALQAVTGMTRQFPDGVYFVSLQAVTSAEFLVSAVADALDVTFSGQDDLQTQLLNYLRDKRTLLVLDNFEQLLSASFIPSKQRESGGESLTPEEKGPIGPNPQQMGFSSDLPAGDVMAKPSAVPERGDARAALLLTQILHPAPAVTLLVTSREALNLQEEWLYLVEGLASPNSTHGVDWKGADAVQLFIQRAQRVRRDFSLEAEGEAVVHLCRLIEGMPLAIELAASWLKTLTCADIVAEIQGGLDFLVTTLRDVPQRHRSMRAVFDHSWGRLAPQEQDVLMRLSVFRGGFRLVAAQTVAGAPLPILTALVDKSLLRWDPDARRYQIHELLRQFSEERLSSSPEALAHTLDLHATYYTHFLGDRFSDLMGERQQAALAEVSVELDNIRVAWAWAVNQCRVADLEYAAMGLHTFYQYQGHFLEAAQAFASAVAVADEAAPSAQRERALAVLLTCSGWLEIRFGWVEEAAHLLERAVSIYEALDRLPSSGMGTDLLTALALLAVIRGEYEQALDIGERAWQRAAARDDKMNQSFAGNWLAGAALAQGDYNTALAYARQALALAQSAGNRWFMAHIYSHLGQVHQALGDLGPASDYYQASYTLKEELNDPEGMALALSHLGEIALTQNDYAQAHDLYQQSMALYQKLGDRGGLVRTLHGLGIACFRVRDEPGARHHFRRALQVASEAQLVPLTLSLLAGAGEFLIQSGSHRQGLAILSLVANHPSSEQTTRDKVLALLRPHDTEGAAMPLSMVAQPKSEADLDAVLTNLLGQLAMPVSPTNVTAPSTSQPLPGSDQSLVDPLTQRELEVLHLVAQGLTNRQIADTLSVVLGTVKAHTSNIYSKLGVSNRTQAVARAQTLRLL
jgi:predicted ATPase/DNA-binding CsgD family transcriptional regulator